MTATGEVRRRSDESLRRGFAYGTTMVLAAFVVIAAVIHLANSGHDRPEGVAERWLAAVSDTTRKGVHDEAVERAEKVGPVSLAQPLLPSQPTGGKRAFPDLEVGKAVLPSDGTAARVPFHLHVFEGPVRTGTLVLHRVGSGSAWQVVGLDERRAGEAVPSEGGDPPSRAPFGVWVGMLLSGFVLTSLCALAVRMAGPAPVH